MFFKSIDHTATKLKIVESGLLIIYLLLFNLLNQVQSSHVRYKKRTTMSPCYNSYYSVPKIKGLPSQNLTMSHIVFPLGSVLIFEQMNPIYNFQKGFILRTHFSLVIRTVRIWPCRDLHFSK